MPGPIWSGARALAEAGWAVFPVDATTKRPRTPHGHLDATTDVARVDQWSRTGAFIGGAIATPTGNGLLVVDVDPRNGGEVPSWAPETLTVHTQSGGVHLYYAIDGPWKSRASLFGPGIDSKADGGYVLVPPSPGYQWANVAPKVALSTEFLTMHVAPEQRGGATRGASRLAPEQWRRGIIHDQVVAWAAWFASVMDDDQDVIDATWDMVNAARRSGVTIDNARGHIDSAIRWVLAREAAKASHA
jgi:hypothetical protein